jgi:hypothetical protein
VKALDLAALMELNEERRPGIRKIAERFLELHPSWDTDRLACEAKVYWHRVDDQKRRQAEHAAGPDCPEGGKCTANCNHCRTGNHD